jgi:acyl-CoA thioesterase FadM
MAQDDPAAPAFVRPVHLDSEKTDAGGVPRHACPADFMERARTDGVRVEGVAQHPLQDALERETPDGH